MYKIVICLLLLGCSAPKFKSGDCVKDNLHGKIRVVLGMNNIFNSRYRYILYSDNVDKVRYFRASSFDQLMAKVECPKEAL